MQRIPSIVVLSTDAVYARLRSVEGIRALGDSTQTMHGSLDGFLHGGSHDVAVLTPELATLLASRESQGAKSIVAIWVATRPGDVTRFIDALRRIGTALGSALQEDRLPLPLSGCVIVAPAGCSEDDRANIERILRGHAIPDAESDALYHVIPPRPTVFLMCGKTRVNSAGNSWSCDQAWPTAVGRLLASIALQPERVPGLRAWRAFALGRDLQEARALDIATLGMVRTILAADQETDDEEQGLPLRSSATDSRDRRASKQKDDDLRPLDPPRDRVNSDDCPRHALDTIGSSLPAHPALPSFWAIKPSDDESCETARGGASDATESRVDERSGNCGWLQRKQERGERFLEDRFQRVREALRTFIGPRSVVDRVWRRIHDSPTQLTWHANGGFFRFPANREVSLVAEQMMQWQRISALDREAAICADCARAQSTELDLARSHFLSLGWRITCVVCSALYAAAAIGIGAGLLGTGVTLAVGIGAGISAIATGALLLALELWKGRRGRRMLERTVQNAERARWDAFHARVELGAKGELIQRSTAWLQSAARVRETAFRLLALEQETLRTAASLDGDLTAGTTAELTLGYAECTTVRSESDGSLTPMIDAIRRDANLRHTDRRAEFDQWWEARLRELDPTGVGGIPAYVFRPVLTKKVTQLRDEIRALVLAKFEADNSASWCEGANAALLRLLGPSTDLPSLSVMTTRARGEDLERTSVAISPSPTIRAFLIDGAAKSILGTSTTVSVETPSEDWCGLGLFLDEVTIRFPETTDGRMHDRFLEGRLHPHHTANLHKSS